MKFFFYTTLLALAACGKYDIPTDVNFSEPVSLSKVEMGVGSSEYENIKDICDAIDTKTQTISSLVSTPYTFENTIKNCDDSGFDTTSETAVTLVNQNGDYKFAEKGGNLFYFSEPETSDSGSLKVICDNLASLSSPIAIDANNYLVFTTTKLFSGDCGGEVAKQKCIFLTKTDARGLPYTREWIRIKLDQSRLGFFTYRKLTSSASCLEGKYFGRTAKLK